jgi:Cu-Zn family superoxide dismutase
MKKINYFLFIGAASIAMSCGSGTDNSGDSLNDSLGIAPGSPNETDNVMGSEDAMSGETATATLASASGSNASGTATFSQTDDGVVQLVLHVENLTPGTHAVHLHENGDCSAEDASSAGGHWNPTSEDHGKRGENDFHSGDITNLTVGEDGVGHLEMDVEGWSIGGSEETSILNKSIIVHADPDDFKSQPAGAAGARVACGVIEAQDRATRVP